MRFSCAKCTIEKIFSCGLRHSLRQFRYYPWVITLNRPIFIILRNFEMSHFDLHFCCGTLVHIIHYSSVIFQGISILLVAKDAQSNSNYACCLFKWRITKVQPLQTRIPRKKMIFPPIFTIFYFFLATSPLLFSATNKDNFNWFDVLDRQFYPVQIQSKRNFLHDAPFGRYQRFFASRTIFFQKNWL